MKNDQEEAQIKRKIIKDHEHKIRERIQSFHEFNK